MFIYFWCLELNTKHTPSYTLVSRELHLRFSWCIDQELLGKVRSRRRKRRDGAFSVLKVISKTKWFIWLLAYVFADILLSKAELQQ